MLPGPLKVLVLTEDWRRAAIESLPLLNRLACDVGVLDVRFFLRDQHPDLMDRFLKDGRSRTIPVIACFDAAGRELGHRVELLAAHAGMLRFFREFL